eukprot:NODE_487_length_6903_cov_0.412111.p5 type:complete len:124 gc:universal NODE_487_length_6903_cov_0.412111:5427-5798(+)
MGTEVISLKFGTRIFKTFNSMSSPRRRIESDVMKLLMSESEVSLVNDNMQEFYVNFKGPEGTPFENGVWKIHVELPDAYPYKSPSIGFVNKIFHPNMYILLTKRRNEWKCLSRCHQSNLVANV